MANRSPFDPDTHFAIVPSDTPVSEDGYKLGEPKRLECDACSASVLLTRQPSAGVDELQHDPDCPQRFVRSDWWAMQFSQLADDRRLTVDQPTIADGGRNE